MIEECRFCVREQINARKPYGEEYNGIVITLYHDTPAIIWDCHVVRQCTSVSRPDRPDAAPVNISWKRINHLLGTFTAAKEKVVAVGWTLAGAAGHAASLDTVLGAIEDSTTNSNKEGKHDTEGNGQEVYVWCVHCRHAPSSWFEWWWRWRWQHISSKRSYGNGFSAGYIIISPLLMQSPA
jgi:hypothetical protein